LRASADIDFEILSGQCAGAKTCPLSQIEEGATVRVKQLSTTPEVTARLRELGVREEQKIKVLARQSNFICQVCNARLGLSHKLAEAILVQSLANLKNTPKK
jgi:Fe2+ transport system protein FeoA